MRKIRFYLCGLCGWLILGGCSSQVSLKTVPDGVSVFVYDSKAKTYQKSGTTPLSLRPLMATSSDGVLQLRLDHPSKLPTYLTIPNEVNGDLDMTVQLGERTLVEDMLQEVTLSLYQIRVDMSKNNVSEAESKLALVKQKYGYLSIVYLYQAEIDLLKQDKPSAINHLQRALELAPDNPPANMLLQGLKKL